QFYNIQYAKLWGDEHINPEELKTGPDFDKLAAKIKELPKTVSSELQEPIKVLLEKAGLGYDKVKNLFIPKDKVTTPPAPAASPAPTPPPPGAAMAPADNAKEKPAKKKA